MINRPVLGWHFLNGDGRLAYGNRQHVRVGEWLYVGEPLRICEVGLHASSRLIDALNYAPGPILCRVELAGELIEQDDKFCASQRRVIAMADASALLHEFACLAAESVLHNIKNPAHLAAARAAIDTKRLWVADQASNAQLSAAWSAAGSAAAWSAEAAEAAAAAAARSAAWSARAAAARAAAWSAEAAAAAAAAAAARSAGSAGSAEAARSSQDATLTRMAKDLLGCE